MGVFAEGGEKKSGFPKMFFRPIFKKQLEFSQNRITFGIDELLYASKLLMHIANYFC